MHDFLGTTGSLGDLVPASENTGLGERDLALLERGLSSTGLPPLPGWVHNHNGTLVDGDSETPHSLTQTLDAALSTFRTLETGPERSDGHSEGVEFGSGRLGETSEVYGTVIQEDEEGDVVLPKPLNNVSSVFFNNSIAMDDEAREQRELERVTEFTSSHGGLSQHADSSSKRPVETEADDSWVSPVVPHFHRLSDLDASDALQRSVNDTLITKVERSVTQVNAEEETAAGFERVDGMDDAADRLDPELLDTVRSQKTPSSYHSDVDAEIVAKSLEDFPLPNSKRRLTFDAEGSSQASDTDLKYPAGGSQFEDNRVF